MCKLSGCLKRYCFYFILSSTNSFYSIKRSLSVKNKNKINFWHAPGLLHLSVLFVLPLGICVDFFLNFIHAFVFTTIFRNDLSSLRIIKRLSMNKLLFFFLFKYPAFLTSSLVGLYFCCLLLILSLINSVRSISFENEGKNWTKTKPFTLLNPSTRSHLFWACIVSHWLGDKFALN